MPKYTQDRCIDKVVAITVTYNRSRTLEKTIRSLLNQSYAIFKIIIVDNNSNAVEKESISAIAILSDKIEVIWLNENLGGAGGFECGMSIALKNYQADWYWIMDDDAYPRPNCLETLLCYKKYNNNIGCLAPVIFGIDNGEYQLYHHKLISKYTMKEKKLDVNYLSLNEVTKIDANAFVGPLFSNEALRTVGIADGGLFIYGDDTEYTYRVSRKFSVLLIKNAIIDHQDPPISNNIAAPNSWWKEYYRLRNYYLFIKAYQKKLLIRIFAEIYLSFKILKSILAAILKAQYKGFRKARITLLLSAMKDGLSGNKGKTLDPIEFLKKLKN